MPSKQTLKSIKRSFRNQVYHLDEEFSGGFDPHHTLVQVHPQNNPQKKKFVPAWWLLKRKYRNPDFIFPETSEDYQDNQNYNSPDQDHITENQLRIVQEYNKQNLPGTPEFFAKGDEIIQQKTHNEILLYDKGEQTDKTLEQEFREKIFQYDQKHKTGSIPQHPIIPFFEIKIETNFEKFLSRISPTHLLFKKLYGLSDFTILKIMAHEDKPNWSFYSWLPFPYELLTILQKHDSHLNDSEEQTKTPRGNEFVLDYDLLQKWQQQVTNKLTIQN